MRSRMLVTLVLLTLATFAMAQQSGSTGSTTGSGDPSMSSPGSSSDQTTASPTGSGDQTMPAQSGSGDSAMSPSGSATDSQTSPGPTSGTQGTSPGAGSQGQGSAAAENVIDGCLGGAAPNFTVTSTEGTVYRLEIPQDADTSAIAAHIGEPVQVSGTMSPGAGSGTRSIQVSRMGTGGSGNCSKSGQAPSTR